MTRPDQWPTPGQALASEFVGTFFLVFAGTGAIIVNDLYGGGITHVGIALVFGLTVAAVIYALGDVSGAHINPAVTVGFWLARRFPGRQVLPYIVSQAAGAVVASVLLLWLFPDHVGYGATLPADAWERAFTMEAILTFLLMLTIISVAVGARERGLIAGVAIGGVVTLAAIFGGPVSGASMNPARSLGPAVVSGELGWMWLYLVAPLIGAGLSIGFCRLVQRENCCR